MNISADQELRWEQRLWNGVLACIWLDLGMNGYKASVDSDIPFRLLL